MVICITDEGMMVVFWAMIMYGAHAPAHNDFIRTHPMMLKC